jgi:acyl dehydratase
MSEKALSRKAWEKDVDAYIAEMNQLVGKPCVASIDIGGTWPQAHSYVTEEVIKDFAWNTGCNNPLFTDPEYAKNTVWGGVIAPAGRFLQYIAETGYFPRGRSIPGVTSLYGGTTYDCYGVVRAGEHYHIVDEFLGVTEKTSDNPYRLLVKTSKRNYVNQDGKTVVTATGNTIMTCKFPEEGKGGGSVFSNIVRPHYSDEELEAIHRHYEDYYDGKLTRGAETRYWEDVSENEELTAPDQGAAGYHRRHWYSLRRRFPTRRSCHEMASDQNLDENPRSGDRGVHPHAGLPLFRRLCALPWVPAHGDEPLHQCDRRKSFPTPAIWRWPFRSDFLP